MGSRNQFLDGQMPQTQPSQQLGFPASFWPPCPSQAPVTFNPCMAHQCSAMGQVFTQQQNSIPQSPNPGEQPPWFQALVTAVYTEIMNKEKKGVVAVADPQFDLKGASSSKPGELSPEDEKVLLKALKNREETGLTVQQIFKELSLKYGHEEIVWKTWFIANFEKLYPKTACTLDSTSSLSREGHPSSCQAGPRTRSASSSYSSRSSATMVINEGQQSSGESEVSESESNDDDDFLLPDIAPHSGPLPRGGKALKLKQRNHVTKSDLRAMALYICEKGNPETRRYQRSSWREFSERPRNQKRSLDAWISVPRIARHAAQIDWFVKYQETMVAKSKTGVPTPPPNRSVASSFKDRSPLTSGYTPIDLTIETEE